MVNSAFGDSQYLQGGKNGSVPKVLTDAMHKNENALELVKKQLKVATREASATEEQANKLDLKKAALQEAERRTVDAKVALDEAEARLKEAKKRLKEARENQAKLLKEFKTLYKQARWDNAVNFKQKLVSTFKRVPTGGSHRLKKRKFTRKRRKSSRKRRKSSR